MNKLRQRLSEKMVSFLLVFYENQREHEKRRKKGRELLRAHGMTSAEPKGAKSLSLTEQKYLEVNTILCSSVTLEKNVTIADETLYHDEKKLQSSLIFVTQYHRCSHKSCAEAWLKIVLWYFAKFVG